MSTPQPRSDFDPARADAFAGRFLTALNDGALCLMVSIGHRTGLFDVLGGLPPATSDEIATRAGLHERYVREWLGAMVTAGVVEVEPATTRFVLPAEHAGVLTRAAAADNLAVFAQYIALLGGVEDDVVESFDFVTTFDAVHDQARPLSVLRGIHRALKPDGVYLMQDIKASSHVHPLPNSRLEPTPVRGAPSASHRAGTARGTPRGGCVMKASMRHSFLLAPVLALASLAAAQSPTPQVDAQDSSRAVVVTPGTLTWGAAPAVLPAGAKAAVIEGDPAKPGPFTLRLRFPASYRIPPHFHPAIEHVTVLQGTLLVGMGERFDAAKLQPLPAGSFGAIPVGMRHFAQARSETVIQLHGIGPWGLTYVNPADDPRTKTP